MKIRIPEPTTWRPDGMLFAFGDYRVPEEMSEELAKRAVAEGAAVVLDDGDASQAAKAKPAKARAA